MSDKKPSMALFWGCFIALVTTSFAFITRTFMVNDPTLWPSDFGLDAVKGQELFGAGIWPFAISIILFSLVIDKIGYRAAMVFSFVCYALYAGFALAAYGTVKAAGLEGDALLAAQASAYNKLYLGSVILGLGNGTVEAFINPVVATMFNREKTKWLNILHAGWPGGLVLGGLLTILLGDKAAQDWRILIYIIAIPAIVYLLMLITAKFPVNEREAAGVSYREMLAEFGAVGAAIAFGLMFRQLGMVFGWPGWLWVALAAVSVVAYGVYCKSLGRPLMIFMCLIMIPLATTEIGTDGAITGIMEEPMKAVGQNPLWVLIYTSAIMMVLRFFAGPIVHALQPLGLLAVSAILAIAGLFWLSTVQGLVVIFAAATLYGFGKTFFWPTTLGVVAEQTPKGGALTLNAISGIGMLAVGILGAPVIGKMVESGAVASVTKVTEADVVGKDTYFLGDYEKIDAKKVAALPDEERAVVEEAALKGKQISLRSISVFPVFMLLAYIGLIVYFRSKGGYKPIHLGQDDEKFTGGLEGPAEL